MKEIFSIVLFLLVPLARADYDDDKECYVTFHETMITHSRTWSCRTLNCTFEILPRPNHFVVLQYTHEQSNVYSAFHLYETYKDPEHINKTNSIIKALIGSKQNFQKTYKSDVGHGFILHMDDYPEGNCKRWKNFPKFSFKRVPYTRKINQTNSQKNCDTMFVTVSNETVHLQKKRKVNVREDCPYQLTIDSKRVHFGDSLYIYSPGEQNLWETYENFREMNELHVVHNWTTLEVLTVWPNDDKDPLENAFQSEIRAISTNRSCNCGDAQVLVPVGKTVTLRSAGYPDFLCPHSHCVKKLMFTSENKSSDYVSRVLISLNSSALENEKTDLRLDSSFIEFNFNSTWCNPFVGTFLMKDDNLTVTHHTFDTFPVETNGHFEMNVTHVSIPKECDCSTFWERSYNIDKQKWSSQVVIPSKCELMYCEWSFFDVQKRVYEVIIDINRPKLGDFDEVVVRSNSVLQKYRGTQLFHRRSLILSEIQDGASISFLRQGKDEELTIDVTWIFTEHPEECLESQNFLVSEKKKQTISSPNYPNPYFPLHSCDFRFEAPKGEIVVVHIDDVDVEQHHDHLRFYDGNSTDSEKIKHVTGSLVNEDVRSSGNSMLIKFNSDVEGPPNQGFHFTVYSEKPSSMKHLIAAIFIILLVILLVVAVILLRKKNNKRETNLSFENELVQFQSEHTGSTVTILS